MTAKTEIALETVNGWAVLPSSLKRADKTPRFKLNFPAYFGTHVGARNLTINESDAGYELPTRNLIERLLRRGDLFIDVGAHWGLGATRHVRQTSHVNLKFAA